jgi:hypothetical protein
MGEKKQKEATMKQVKKILVVGACVLFVVLMIVSGMGSGWISSFTIIRPGDVALIDYTIYDAGQNPIITTDQQIFKQAVGNGRSVLFSKQILVTSNQSLPQTLFPVQVYSADGGWSRQFAFFATEYNAISAGIVGMKANEQKRLNITSSVPMTQLWSVDQLKRNGVNITDINDGDILAMAVSDNPAEMAANKSALTYVRLGEVSGKSPQGVVVDFGYPSADVRIVSINPRR